MMTPMAARSTFRAFWVGKAISNGTVGGKTRACAPGAMPGMADLLMTARSATGLPETATP
jgi:hypothetical protein